MRRIKSKHWMPTGRSASARSKMMTSSAMLLREYRGRNIPNSGPRYGSMKQNPFATYRILFCHFDKVRFSGTGLADCIQMPTSVIIGNTDFRFPYPRSRCISNPSEGILIGGGAAPAFNHLMFRRLGSRNRGSEKYSIPPRLRNLHPLLVKVRKIYSKQPAFPSPDRSTLKRFTSGSRTD